MNDNYFFNRNQYGAELFDKNDEIQKGEMIKEWKRSEIFKCARAYLLEFDKIKNDKKSRDLLSKNLTYILNLDDEFDDPMFSETVKFISSEFDVKIYE